ncbi:uncharacterized protein LOC110835588 isoform X2 [Zootermopsis nevadensis]|uniref:uncharacterized protein LOC110835588 isoform X2 n=1 Tax=Zootermopsis nevadensis TaxID=136037 RepID=UPI000B8ECC21|nr:uncharacterized protein LOC110835588 isoform X2 [Zootermopsis nevadensis]
MQMAVVTPSPAIPSVSRLLVGLEVAALCPEIAMNNKKSPKCLIRLTQRKICRLIVCRILIWTKKLRKAERRETGDRLRVIHAVLSQCLQLREVLTKLQESDGRLLSDYFVRVIARVIEDKDIPGHSREGTMPCRYQYEEVCMYMLRNVFLPCLEECNIKKFGSEFVHGLMSQSLHTITHITRLILPDNTSNPVSQIIYDELPKLTMLQEIIWKFTCTTRIIAVLARNCRLLRKLDVACSINVTNNCVEDLLNMESLEILNVGGTGISEKSYALLLSRLPRIQSFFWKGRADDVFRYITRASLPLINEFSGVVTDASLLVRMCPHVKTLAVYLQSRNCSELVNLSDLVVLELSPCNYNTTNMGTVIENMGIRLTRLIMIQVANVDIVQIITSCSVLKILDLRYCRVITPENFSLSPELPHFTSVNEIILSKNQDFRDFHKYLVHYVNLEVFHAHHVAEVDHAIISAILNAGGFRKLTKIVLAFCGHLKLDTAMLLIQKCDYLTFLGNMNTWRDFSEDDTKTLMDCIKVNNLALFAYLD